MSELDLFKQSFKFDRDALVRWLRGEDELKATPQCFTVSELRYFSDISSPRLKHLLRCDFCWDVLGSDGKITRDQLRSIL